jgi:hypothetical protein
MSRIAIAAGSTPHDSARALVTSCWEMPTRNEPPMSLFQTSRCGPVQGPPGVEDRPPLLVLALVAQRQQQVLDPVVQRQVGRPPRRRRRQQQGDRLGQVADRVVALAEEPLGDVRLLGRPGAEPLGGDDLARTAADEEVDRPRRVGRRGGGEVAAQRLDLGVDLGRRVQGQVQLGKGSHGMVVGR